MGRRIVVIAAAICALWVTASASQPSTPADSLAQARWSSFLPLMKEEAIARGYDLPLPFGVSVIYNYLARDIDVTDIRIGVDGEPLQSVSRFLNLGSDSNVNAFLGRVDAWLLPFLNLYVLVGYIDNESTSTGHVTVPRPGPIPGSDREFDIEIPTSLTGFVGGGGISLAAGYREFFMMVDANYSQTDIGFDDRFRAIVASARAGWNGRVRELPTRFWLGAASWDTENTATSTVDIEGVGQVRFEADQGPSHPWNATLGTQVSFSKTWESMFEYGFNFGDVHIVIAGVTYRF